MEAGTSTGLNTRGNLYLKVHLSNESKTLGPFCTGYFSYRRATFNFAEKLDTINISYNHTKETWPSIRFNIKNFDEVLIDASLVPLGSFRNTFTQKCYAIFKKLIRFFEAHSP